MYYKTKINVLPDDLLVRSETCKSLIKDFTRQVMHKFLKGILKFTLKLLQHVSV